MIPTYKSDGLVRHTVDLQKLNEAKIRETHHTPTPTKAWVWDDTMTALFKVSKEDIVKQVCADVKSLEAG